ncbi:hypothetical protein SERLA73DRAFT_129617, partial [Serpula lacrymans var. lacrymans S7.3]
LFDSCKRYTFFRQLLLVVNQVIVCILLTLRTYALYGRNNRLLAFMVGFGAVLVAAASWALVGQHSYAATNVSGCHIAYTTSTSHQVLSDLAVAWEALFLYDTSMLVLTLLKTYKATRQHGLLSFNGRLNIVTLMCRDGETMAIANLSNILTFYIAPVCFSLQWISFVSSAAFQSLLKGTLSTFASCISVTLMTRLMLNLHKSADTGILTTHANVDTGGMVFTSNIASTMGPSYDSQHTVLLDLSPLDAPRLSTDIYLELREVSAQNHLQVGPREV